VFSNRHFAQLVRELQQNIALYEAATAGTGVPTSGLILGRT